MRMDSVSVIGGTGFNGPNARQPQRVQTTRSNVTRILRTARCGPPASGHPHIGRICNGVWLSKAKVVVLGETRLAQYGASEPPTEVTALMHWNRHAQISDFVPERKMTSSLAIFHKTVP